MQLNTSTDYAIRLVLYLAKAAKFVSSSKLSSAVGVSPRYLLQVGAKLRDAGLSVTAYGPTGGYGLAKASRDISLYDIIIIMEEKIKARRQADSRCAIEMAEFEILDTAYEYVDGVLGDMLQSITIKNLLSQSIKEWYLVPCLMDLNDKRWE